MLTDPMDNPVWASLTGRHAGLARRAGDALWYDNDHTPFVGVEHERAKVVDDGATKLYEKLGFELRMVLRLTAVDIV